MFDLVPVQVAARSLSWCFAIGAALAAGASAAADDSSPRSARSVAARFRLDQVELRFAPERSADSRFAVKASAKLVKPAASGRFQTKALDATCAGSSLIFANSFE